MTGKRRITFTTNELFLIKNGLSHYIHVCMFEIGRTRSVEARNLWAAECAALISAYRKCWVYSSDRRLVGRIADRHAVRLTNDLIKWSEQHDGK